MQRLVLDRPGEVMAAIYRAHLAEPSERALAERAGITVDRFMRLNAGSSVIGLEINGAIAGGMYLHDGRLHLAILPEHRTVWVKSFRRMMEAAFRIQGPTLIAIVGSANLRAQRFVERVGCIRVRERKGYIEYEVSKPRMRYEFTRYHPVRRHAFPA